MKKVSEILEKVNINKILPSFNGKNILFIKTAVPVLSLILSGLIVFNRNEFLSTISGLSLIKNKIVSGMESTTSEGAPDLNVLSAFKESLKPIYVEPEKIKVESVGMDLAMEQVGVDANGVMETPQDWNKAGWYYNSSKPGEIGNLIINGHYDNNYGGPAAFWQLKNIQVGDKVTVVDRYGKLYIYETKESFLVSIDDPNRLDVLDSEEGKGTLTLITCGGIWLPGQSTYDKRLIVKADLVQ